VYGYFDYGYSWQEAKYDNTESVSVPIFQSATFAHPDYALSQKQASGFGSML